MDDIIRVGSQSVEHFIDNDMFPALSSVGVFVAGLATLTDLHYVKRCLSKYVMISITVEGEGRLAINDEEITLLPNFLYVIPSDMAYEISLTEKKYRRTAWLLLDKEYWSLPNQGPITQKNSHLSKQIYYTLKNLYFEQYEDSNDNIVDLLLEQLKSLIHRVMNLEFNKSIDFRLLSLIKAIDNDIGKEWSTDSLCDAAALGKSQLYHLFRATFNQSPKQYISNKRVSLAKQYLGNTQYSITDISLFLGFKSVEHFSTLFRKYSGTSPSLYRKMVLSQI